MTRSDRYIETTATCDAFLIQNISDYNDSFYGVDYTLGDGSLATFLLSTIYSGATYYSQVKDADWERYDIVNCGPRCGLMNVTQVRNGSDLTQGDDPYLYLCQSTVHEVQGADIPEEEISNEIALMAATSLSQGTEGDEFGTSYSAYTAK